jgi:hypothetical protein
MLSCTHVVVAAAAAAVATALTGCASVPPPPSQVPSATAAIDRMRATAGRCTALQASAKIDHFGKEGRVRADLLMFVAVPARLRMDIVSPFGVTLATLTSDGSRFALSDLREKRFYVGPASACNIRRLTTVPLPGSVLVSLLRGQAPVLRHDPGAGTVAWDRHGYYVVTIPSTRTASEELHLAPRTEDRGRPWNEQRLRLVDVAVRQYGELLYHAALDGHAAAPMAKERIDPDGIDPPLPPSGPLCEAELPRRIHVEVPALREDVLFRYDTVAWNPPLPQGTFTQPPPAAMPVVPVECDADE